MDKEGKVTGELTTPKFNRFKQKLMTSKKDSIVINRPPPNLQTYLIV